MKQTVGADAVLPLDAGNSLFVEYYSDDAPARAKAEFILKTEAQLGVKVIGVGMRDLAAGPDWVREQATKHGLKPLSANLAKDGKLLFAPSTVLTVNGIKVGVVGASPPNPFKWPGVTGLPLSNVVAEARKLRPKVDVVIVLAAVPYPDALQLAREAGSNVDFVLQNHDGRGTGPGVPVEIVDNYIVHTGERGRQIARLDLDLSGKGRFVDGAEAERQAQTVAILDKQIAEVKKRIAAATDPAVKTSYQGTLKSFETRRAEVAAAAAKLPTDRRTMRLSYVGMGPDVMGDPAIEKQVNSFGPIISY